MTRQPFLLLIALLAALISPLAKSATLDQAIADLSAPAQAKIKTAVGSFLRAQVKTDRSANDLSWDCQAAAALVDLGVDGAKARLAGIADELLADATRSKRNSKPVGWSAVAERTAACVPAAKGGATGPYCEGESTVYAFQTGLAMACLSRAGALLSRPELTAAAADAMAYWSRLVMPVASCKDCVFFATSDSAGDAERYIRNMNLFIAFGAAELAQSSGNAALRATATKSIRTDIAERQNGNRGYLGRADPLWKSRPGEPDRIENHSASMALLLRSMGVALADDATKTHALTVYRDWATCDNKRCLTAGCGYWAGNPQQCQATATAAHCAFRLDDQGAAKKCEDLLSLVPAVGPYAIWSILLAQWSAAGSGPTLPKAPR